jgi:hypothetical protein
LLPLRKGAAVGGLFEHGEGADLSPRPVRKEPIYGRHRAGVEGEKVSGRGSNWTTEEDRRLLDFIEAGKSWVFIAAALKRTTRSIQDRARELKAKGK